MADAGATLRGESQVLVVGAGPAGAAAGITLARAGVDVAVVDRARFPRDKTCGDAISSGAMRVLDELGIGDEVRAATHASVRRATVVFPDGTRVEYRYDPPGCIVPRLRFDDVLRRALERAGARVFEGHHVARLERSGADVRGASGRGFDWRAPIVIAADGSGSFATKATGRRRAHGRSMGLAATAYYEGVHFPFGADTAEHFFEHDLPYGYAWIFPDVDGRTNVGVYLTQDVYRGSDAPLDALLDRFVARHPDRFEAARRAGNVRSWPLPLAPPRRPASAQGLLFAGDAGSFIDPLTGEGIWQALHTGVLAGRTAAEATRAGGVLSRPARLRFEWACQRDVVLPSVGKAAAQSAMRWLIASRLYRAPPVRAALRWGHGLSVFELSRQGRR